jgi:hypothetical protein
MMVADGDLYSGSLELLADLDWSVRMGMMVVLEGVAERSPDLVQCAYPYILDLLARIFHELLSRDHEDGRATGQPQGVGSEAYLNGTSQGPTPEDARKDGHIRGRSK